MRLFFIAFCVLCSLSQMACFYTRDGEPCFGADGSCGDDRYCDVTFAYSGTCEQKKEVGEACDAGYFKFEDDQPSMLPCVDGAQCVNQVCVVGEMDAYCRVNSECKSGVCKDNACL